jgi:hypothetical protein
MKMSKMIMGAALVAFSCAAPRYADRSSANSVATTVEPITQSLFNDKNATISEENIQRILEGTFKLVQTLRVAIVKLESTGGARHYYWNDEEYLKTQQSYLDLFADKLRQSGRVSSVSIMPDILISQPPTFTSLREAAVRLQADVVVVYSISTDTYSKYKVFTKPDIKAFATTQFILLDVRTGLIPFSAIVTKDQLSKKKPEELDYREAASRIQREAVLLTIEDIGEKMTAFLRKP